MLDSHGKLASRRVDRRKAQVKGAEPELSGVQEVARPLMTLNPPRIKSFSWLRSPGER